MSLELRDMLLHVKVPHVNAKINVVQRVEILDICFPGKSVHADKFDHFKELIEDGVGDYERIVSSYEIPEIGSVYYGLFLVDTPTEVILNGDKHRAKELATEHNAVFIDNEPHDPVTDYTINCLRATHEVVARAMNVQLYPPYNRNCVNGAVELEHERGHRMLAHYVNESWLWHLKTELGTEKGRAEYDRKDIHYFGYYDKGVFQIVDEYNTKIVDDNRRYFPKLERH